MNKGSIMILAIIATTILSVMLAAGLMVTTTETQTTQNLYLSQVSYYTAMQGVMQVLDKIRLSSNNESSINSSGIPNNSYKNGAFNCKFITGTMEDLAGGSLKNVALFKGFSPPPLPGASAGLGLAGTIWNITVSSQVNIGKKKAYTEIQVGAYSILPTAY